MLSYLSVKFPIYVAYAYVVLVLFVFLLACATYFFKGISTPKIGPFRVYPRSYFTRVENNFIVLVSAEFFIRVG